MIDERFLALSVYFLVGDSEGFVSVQALVSLVK